MFCVCPHMCVCFSEYDICRVPLSVSEKVVIRIFSRRHYAATQAELPFSGSEMFIIQIFSKHHKAATKTEFPFQG